MRLSFLPILVSFLFLFSCSQLSKTQKAGQNMTLQFTQKALFEYLRQPEPYFREDAGNGPFKIDPVLYRREILTINEKRYFKNRMHSKLLKEPLPAQSYRVTIPESLVDRYVLAPDSIGYERDYAVIFQFSPLLPTKDLNIYLMEEHLWFNRCQGDDCYRMLSRGYLRFRKQGRKIVFIDKVSIESHDDFIGFGGFSRKKMEAAQPGDKILRFGSGGY